MSFVVIVCYHNCKQAFKALFDTWPFFSLHKNVKMFAEVTSNVICRGPNIRVHSSTPTWAVSYSMHSDVDLDRDA